MQSFDAAHRGRCPGCGMNDNGNHIVHRYWRTDVAEIFINNVGDPIYGEKAIAAYCQRGIKFMRRDLEARGIAA